MNQNLDVQNNMLMNEIDGFFEEKNLEKIEYDKNKLEKIKDNFADIDSELRFKK